MKRNLPTRPRWCYDEQGNYVLLPDGTEIPLSDDEITAQAQFMDIGIKWLVKRAEIPLAFREGWDKKDE